MAFVKTKQQGQRQMQNRVGGSYGERRQLMHNPRAASKAQRPAIRKPLDSFSGKRADASRFAPNAKFQTSNGAVQDRNTPYKTALHSHVENGSAPVSAGAGQPSTGALLRFLDKVIDRLPERRPSRSNVAIKSKPLKKVRTRQQAGTTKVKPRLPRSQRPIPSIGSSGTKSA